MNDEYIMIQEHELQDLRDAVKQRRYWQYRQVQYHENMRARGVATMIWQPSEFIRGIEDNTEALIEAAEKLVDNLEKRHYDT